MKILLHTCCGPCSIHPVSVLRKEGFDVMGYFYRNNIHPYMECLKRETTLKDYAESIELSIIIQKGYDVEGFLRNIVFRETERCLFCYQERFKATAIMAKNGKFDCFSSTLLYSRFQNHDLIKSIGEAVSNDTGVDFYYRDFRDGWKFGVEESKKLGLYRQQYCGCIFSEKDRYYKKENT